MSTQGLTVAVTGPTGDIGRAALRALDRSPEVSRIVGMARRPFDPAGAGLHKVEYRQGDILERASVEDLVRDVDVVVHLAFLIFGSHDETHEINMRGSRNVFEAALEAGVKRLVYTSSVAAYGWHDDNPDLLTEDVPPRGTDAHYYSAQKAAVEQMLENLSRVRKDTDVFVFRPCIVAGGDALMFIEKIPYVKIGEKLPGPVRKVVDALPVLRPIVPDPGVAFQLVHTEDVAQAIVLAVEGRGEPGHYNLAGDGEITVSDVAHALGWYVVPLPDIAVDATVKVVSALPMLPAEARWVKAIDTPVIVDTTRARSKLGWEPRYDALETLADTVASARAKGMALWQPTGEPAEAQEE
jgi:nucleoside-diphosphate-sugar epimerase